MAKEKRGESEAEKKVEVLRTLSQSIPYMIPLVLMSLFNIFMFEFLFESYPTSYIIYATFIFISLSLFPVYYFIKKKMNSLSSSTIYLIMAVYFFLQMIAVSIIAYLWTPLIKFYFGGGVLFILGLALVLWIIESGPIFNNKKYIYFLFFSAYLIIITFAFLEYIGIYPEYPNYPVGDSYLVGQVKPLALSLFLVLIVVGVINTRLQNFWSIFREHALELKVLNKNLDQRVNERTRELKVAKEALEIRVAARTKELKANVDELEKFRKLSVGRELKMIELKKRSKDANIIISELSKRIKQLEEKSKK